jgi:hypothetical protein
MTDSVLSAVLGAVVGGVLAIAGAYAGNWFQLRTTLRARMNQVIAERKVSANADAYRYMKVIELHLTEHTDAEALAFMHRRENWMFANRLFLPSAFAETWRSLRTTLRWISETPPVYDSETLRRLRLQALKLARKAMREIYHDMDLENGGPDIKAPA